MSKARSTRDIQKHTRQPGEKRINTFCQASYTGLVRALGTWLTFSFESMVPDQSSPTN